MNQIKISIVDDQTLFRKGIKLLLKDFDNYSVIQEAANGKEFIDAIDQNNLPEIVLMDIDMPVMNGFQTCQWLNDNYPEIRVIALSMYKDEQAIIKMLKAGAKGYLLKETEPEELKITLDEVHKNGFCYTERVGKVLMDNLTAPIPTISEIEMSFLKLVCTEMTYKEIADKMNVSPRTVDNYRESLFDKLKIKNRIGLAIYAIRHGIYHV